MGENVLVNEGGATVARPREEADILGLSPVDPAVRDADLRRSQTKKMFDTPGDAALTFAEGIVDALSAGFIRETGDMADLRREENSGWATSGVVAGTAGALLTGVGPAALAAKGGEALGRAAAKTFLRAGDKALATTIAAEAAAGAAMTGATAFGHQVMDAVIEDREFSAEAILHEAKLGGILGAGGGLLIGGFGKVAKRGHVTDQGGLIGDPAIAGRAIDDSIKAYDEAFDFYKQQYGGLKGMHDMGRLGPVSDGFMDVRKAAIQQAERAQKALRALDPEVALSGVDDGAHVTYRKAASNYRRALRDVDDIMRADWAERAQAMELSQVTRIELNPLGKMAGDLDDIAARQAVFDDQMMARMESEAAGGPMGAPSETPTAKTGAASPRAKWGGEAGSPNAPYGWNAAGERGPRAIADLAPATADESAARAMGALDEARQAAQANTVVDALPMGERVGIDARKARLQANIKQADQVLTTARAAGGRSKPAVDATVVDDLPAGAAEGALAKDFDAARTGVAPAKTEVRPAIPDSFNVQDWFNSAQPGRTRPFHKAEARALAAMEELRAGAGGRMESAGAMGLVKAPAAGDDLLGPYMDQVVSMRKAARFAADEGRGAANPLFDAMKQALGGIAIGSAFGSKALGLAAGFAGYGGRLASASGKLYRKAVDSVATFMSSTKVRVGAVAGTNIAHAYSEKGPIEDPVERIQEIQFLASQPEAVKARVRNAAGDLVKVAPELVSALEMRAVNQMQRLAVRAPAIFFDKLGRPLSPPMGKMREFHEYENGIHDLEGLLDGIANGFLTKPQVSALQDGFPSMHVKVASMFLSDPEKLQTLIRAKLRMVEMVTGTPLTGATDPMFLMRQAAAWVPPAPPAQPQAPQAFNINPSGAPTPSQANATGRAPGN